MIAWQDPPPYVQFAQEAEQLASTASACDQVGYVTDLEAGEAELRNLARRGVLAGVGADWTASAFRSAVRQQTSDLEAMAPSEDASQEERRLAARQTRQLLTARCAEASVRYPNIVWPGPDAGKVFMGWMGPWLDFPLVSEASYYLSARSTCERYVPELDRVAILDRWMTAFSDVPASARQSLRAYLDEAYEPASDTPLTAAQCARVMERATLSLSEAWTAHFKGNPTIPALP